MDRVLLADNYSLGVSMENSKEYKIQLYHEKELVKTLRTLNASKSPTSLEPTRSQGKMLFSDIEDVMTNEWKDLTNTAKKSRFSDILSKLDPIVNSLKHNFNRKVNEEKDKEISEEQEKIEKQMEETYAPLYQQFLKRCDELGSTPLIFISQITKGLGVDLTIEVLRAFFAYLQTYTGLKGTNAIAVASQSAGKTHVLEQALRLIPEERIHTGVTSSAYFFRKFNHMDLTGHIFYLQDLGGANSDMNTIEVRDMLKQLTTDGYLERGVVDDDKNTEDQWVKGYPCLTYSTVAEEIVNEQERSRSVIITPPEVDLDKLVRFKTTMNSPGRFSSTISQIKKDVESVKGLVWSLGVNNQETYFFNPYLFGVVEHLKHMEDFNRKIDEFNQVLLLCCKLNNGFMLDYNAPGKDFRPGVNIPLYVASEQDNLDAFKIFDATYGLMPTELKLGKGLLKVYNSCPVHQDSLTATGYELQVRRCFEELTDEAVYDDEDEYANTFFTSTMLRKEHSNQRWYRMNKEDIDVKLERLYLNNFLVQAGKTDNKEVVYCLNRDAKDKLELSTPDLTQNLQDGKDLFYETFPSLKEEFDKFMEEDTRNKTTTNPDIVFDIDAKNCIYDLSWYPRNKDKNVEKLV